MTTMNRDHLSTLDFGAFSMTTDHDHDTDHDDHPFTKREARADITDELRFTTAAVRVSFTWFGTRKALDDCHRDQIASEFSASSDFISAGKKLISTKHPTYRAVTAIRTKILTDWRDSSLPFPEQGIRLIRQDSVEAFQTRMENYRDELANAVASLQDHFTEIQDEARQRLGSLYDADDYPSSLRNLFGVTWDFPNVEPPDYLLQLQPSLYEAERARVAAQFDQAVNMAEEAFITQFSDCIMHLCERLGRGDDGSPKVFRDSAISNLTDFFERFRTLGIRSNAQLDALVEQAQEAIGRSTPNRLRSDTNFRDTIARHLANVGEQITEMQVNRPRRNLLRPSPSPSASPSPRSNDEETEK